jgi:feruloyl-CoA synthase
MNTPTSTPDFFSDEGMLARPQVELLERPDGAFILRSALPTPEPVRCIGEWLEHWAVHRPNTVFLAERDAAGDWRRLTYAQVRDAVGRLAQALLDHGLPEGGAVVALSDNAVDHALLMLATMHIGRPFCTISSAYSRLAKEPTKLRQMLDMVGPALIYASDANVYGAIAEAAAPGVPKLFSDHAETLPGALDLHHLLATEETPAVRERFDRIQGGDAAKYLLTSGSTGVPKAVVNTHRMLCANQAGIALLWPFLTKEPPVIVDWLPWSHTFGTNHNFNMVLCHGGSLYVDEGRPLPGQLEKSVRNLREVRPNMYFNVPRGFDAIAPILEGDAAFAQEFFARLRVLFYAGAALSGSTWERLEAVAARSVSHPIWFTSAWGATETAPALTSLHWRIERAGCIGLPVPGVELKFLPNGGKLEMRARGISVFTEYLNAPELTAAAFDEEGFYKIGDAGYFAVPGQPESGVVFDGRVAEDFKLSSGTWVSVGPLRVRALSALAPHVSDAVVTGHDRNEVGLMVFLTPAALQLPRDAVLADLRAGLRRLRDEGAGSSQAPSRLLILDEPPSAEAGEITDKGYINQRAVLTRRAVFVEQLYGAAPATHLIDVKR